MEKVKVGIAGLGRLGKVHANNIAYKIPNAELTAACSIMPAELEYAQNELGVKDVYTDFDEMLAKADIDAVAIVTTSGLHCSQIAKALDAGKHVFSEKPLGVNVEECKQAEVAVERHPELSFFLGFMRRFDPSYAEAKEKIRAGAIGKPILFKGVSLDPSSVLEAHLEGVKKGIYVPWFIEMGSHDTDLARWFLEGDPVDSFATGDAYVCTGLADYNDYDNGFSLTKFDNNTTAYIQVGRTATCSHVESEIVGTKGTLRVNSVPRKNYLSQFTENGFVEECQESFLARWGEAFQAEIDDFVDCVRTGRKPETTAHDGTMSLKFCLQLHQAYLDGKKK